MIPPENDWPPPETLACQFRLGSFLPPFDWNGPESLTWTGCSSCWTPSTFAVNWSVTLPLWIGVLNAFFTVSVASSPPPPPPQPASRATSATTERHRAALSGRKRGDFKREPLSVVEFGTRRGYTQPPAPQPVRRTQVDVTGERHDTHSHRCWGGVRGGRSRGRGQPGAR